MHSYYKISNISIYTSTIEVIQNVHSCVVELHCIVQGV